MPRQAIEALLRRVQELRTGPNASQEERLRVLLQRQRLHRQIGRLTIRGSAAELLEEVNRIYESRVEDDRIKENAKVVHIQLLWSAIAARKARP
jgi:hypothetical protein